MNAIRIVRTATGLVSHSREDESRRREHPLPRTLDRKHARTKYSLAD